MKTDDDLRAAFAARYGVKLSRRRQHWSALLGDNFADALRRDGGGSYWYDHGELWTHKGIPVAFTSHPYDDPRAAIEASALTDPAGRERLMAVVIAPEERASWWNPGHTWFVGLFAASFLEEWMASADA